VTRDALLAAGFMLLGPGCHACNHRSRLETKTAVDPDHDEDDDQSEEQEERNARRPNYWRVQVAIEGQGSVVAVGGALDCRSDGAHQSGECGPKLLTFDELQPPLLRGTGARGWKLARWESQLRQANGQRTARQGPMPDGRWYLNGLGYSDTGALETVTAVFVPAGSGADDLTSDANLK
jgi:hypothetical protein